MRALAIGLLLLGACSKGTRLRPFVELEHRRSHTLETRVGGNIVTPKHDIDVYWAPILGISDHVSQKVSLDYPLAFGVRWRMR